MTADWEARCASLGLERLKGMPLPTQGEIAQLEARLGSKFPDDYRGFLSRFAFAFAPGLCFRMAEYPDMEGGGVEVFFGILHGHGYDLLNNWEGMQSRVPQGLLPIADSPGGLICLSLREPDYGAVYWWGFEHARPRDRELYYAAPTFSEFLNDLYLE